MTDVLKKFDAVIMLTWSDWKTELRSNRYHYASRFSKFLPVIFVQPDLISDKYYYEKTELDNVLILHVSRKYGQKQNQIINQALRARNIIKPLLWIYNCRFSKVISDIWSPLIVYHATEDYFSNSPHQITSKSVLYPEMISTLEKIDLLVSVSYGVEKQIIAQGKYSGDHITITNGCDFNFYCENSLRKFDKHSNVILYQGNINSRLDYALLLELTSRLPECEFWFCGKVSGNNSHWKELVKKSNVKYFGTLTCDDLKNKMCQASVGLIPFNESEYINKSFPLKTFEYLACGLPVVSVPIESLQSYNQIIHFASGVDQFVTMIKLALTESKDDNLISLKQKAAAKNDYDLKFRELCEDIATKLVKKEHDNKSSTRPLEILVLYDSNSIHVSTISEHLRSFKKYSRNNIYYANATDNVDCHIDLSVFDAVIIHYSIRVNTNNCDSSLSPHYVKALKNYGGYKTLFVQDEYDTTNITKARILDLGIHTVFTTVSKNYLEAVYPASEFQNVDFVQTLTGYIPEQLTDFEITPLEERKVWIGYRGRDLPFWYGNLGREKLIIGKELKKICLEKNIPADIEWEADKRIYGDKWYKFISDCRITLGTESGSNVFDFTGEISRNIQLALKKDPSLSYEVIFNKYLAEHEGKIIMNQISPKIFEAIALRTGLVLFEGTYSGIIQPDLHFINLKKDFSNIEDVLAKIADDNYLNAMTDRAYNDVVKSGLFSYKHFINKVDDYLNARLKKKITAEIIPILFAYANHANGSSQRKSISKYQSKTFLSNDLLHDSAALLMVNKIKRMSRFKPRFLSLFSFKLENPVVSNSIMTKALTKFNNVLPGKPLTKIYRLLKKVSHQ